MVGRWCPEFKLKEQFQQTICVKYFSLHGGKFYLHRKGGIERHSRKPAALVSYAPARVPTQSYFLFIFLHHMKVKC